MKLVLAHGMGRSRASLLLLKARLARAGFVPELFGYWVSREPWETIVARYVATVTAHVTAGEPYGLIGHSLGNIIARAASPRLPAGLARIVMLAPPNNPPVLANRFAGNPLFGLFAGEAGKRLADPKFYETLPVPPVPTLVFAGTAGPRAEWLRSDGAAGDEATDGVVSVSETKLPGAEHVEVPSLHTFIMNSAEVTERAVAFLGAARLSGSPARSS